jgi:hypothetical protein
MRAATPENRCTLADCNLKRDIQLRIWKLVTIVCHVSIISILDGTHSSPPGRCLMQGACGREDVESQSAPSLVATLQTTHTYQAAAPNGPSEELEGGVKGLSRQQRRALGDKREGRRNLHYEGY